MRLYLIRHGQSENNYAEHNGIPRVEDPALTAVGQTQAERLAKHLVSRCDPYPVFDPPHTDYDGTFGLTHLFVSPMRRALQTMWPLAQATRCNPAIWDDTHELGGIWLEKGPETFVGLSGMTRAEMEQEFPGYVLSPRITEAGWWNRERETREECDVRAVAVARRLEQLAEAEPQAVVGLVAHQYFLAVLLRALFRLDVPNVWLQHYNTGVTRIDFVESGTKVVRYINRVDHLDTACITT